MKRYNFICETKDGQIIAAGMQEHPEGEWVSYEDMQNNTLEIIDDTLASPEAFETHKKDNKRMYNLKNIKQKLRGR